MAASETQVAEEMKVEAKVEGLESNKEIAEENDVVEGKEPEKSPETAPEKPKELEEDDPVDTRPKITEAIVMSDYDATLDVLVGRGGSLLYGMCSEGFQHLFTCSRANWGLKSGRYLFEFKIIETFGLPAAVRVGFSTDGSSLFLGDTPDSVGFNDNGEFFVGHRKTHHACPHEWGPLSVFGVLVNLVDGAQNGNTLSLFKDGKRVSKPMPLPEHLKGKALFPTFTFKNVTLAVEFGATTGQPQRRLPFSVRLMQDASEADMVANTQARPTKPEVIFPVALPDAGGFDYVDQLLEANGDLVELSDRAVMKWAFKSGNKQTGQASGSNDKPHFSFGTDLDKPTVQKKLKSLAPSMRRNYVVVDILGNLSKAGRAVALARFKGSAYSCVARVLMGKPPADFEEGVHAKILADKLRKRHAEIEKKRNAFLKKIKSKKQHNKTGNKKEGITGKEDEQEATEIDPDVSFTPDVEGSEHYVPPAALTAEDKEIMFTKRALPDVTARALASHFDKFALPDESEGFDRVEFVWESKEACVSILNKYIVNQKVSTPIDSIKPSEWFKEKLQAFETAKKEMRAMQSAAKSGKKFEASVGEVDELICKDFSFEDWSLLQLRYELHLLTLAFKKEVNDTDRPAMPIKHTGFYYQKLFANSHLSPSSFGCDTIPQLVNKLLADCIKVGENDVLESRLPEEADLNDFMKLVEEARKDRVRRVDAGDESANLKFSKAAKASGKGGGASKLRHLGEEKRGIPSKEKDLGKGHVNDKRAKGVGKAPGKPISPVARVPMGISKLARRKKVSGGGASQAARLPPPPPAPTGDGASQKKRNAFAPQRDGNRQGTASRSQQGQSGNRFAAERHPSNYTQRFEGARGGGARDAQTFDRSRNTKGWGSTRDQPPFGKTRGGTGGDNSTRPWKVQTERGAKRPASASSDHGRDFGDSKRQRRKW